MSGRFKGVKQPERLQMAREFLADLSDSELCAATVWKIMDCWEIYRPDAAEHILMAEQLKRGLLSLNELRPEIRRKMVDPANLDLHAIARGPIMDPHSIYLPAGRLSMEETRAREAEQLRAA